MYCVLLPGISENFKSTGIHANPPQAVQDDSFGDFLQGPTTTTAPAAASLSNQSKTAPSRGVDDDFGDFLQGPAEEKVTTPQSQPESVDSARTQQDMAGGNIEDVKKTEPVPSKPAGNLVI